MTANFTPAGYEALLTAFMERGYAVRDFATVDAESRHLVLRHDLDMSLDAALPLAEIERKLDVRASYFVLVRTELYNVLSAAGHAILCELALMGHEIGLHFDASLYGGQDIDAAAKRECDILERALNQPVNTISFHRPTESLLGRPGPLAGRRHTYAPEFFEAMGYCSDSRGDWHHGAPLSHPAIEDGRALQLLTHPIWWNAAAGESVQQKLDRFATARHRLLREELGRNCNTYDPMQPQPIKE